MPKTFRLGIEIGSETTGCGFQLVGASNARFDFIGQC